MAKIPIIENPQAPKVDTAYIGQPAGGNIGVRYQEGMNLERHIPGLMQPELSQGPNAALARANASIGSAIADTGQAFGNFLAGMQESKDAADISFGNNTMRMTHAEFAERVENEGIQPGQQLQLWDSEYAPRINEALVGRKMSPHVQAEVAPKWHIFNSETKVGIMREARKATMRAQGTEIVNDFEASLEAGDWEGALDANTRLTIGHHQTPGEESARKRDILDKKQEWDIREDLGRDPRIVLEEMREIQTTGKSDIYPDLKNPVVVNKWEEIARTEVNNRSVETLREIDDAKQAGQLTRPEDIDRMAKGNLTELQKAALKNELLHDPQYDKEAVVTMRTKVAGYDPETDDASLTKFHTLYEEIGTSVPKDIQGALRSDLYQEYQRKREGKPKDQNKSIDAAIDSEIVKFADAGMFDPEGYSSTEAKKDPAYLLKNRDKHLEVWSKVETYQRQIKEWRAAHPDASPEQVAKQIDQTIGPDLRRSAKKQMDWRKAFESSPVWTPASRPPAQQPPTPAEIRSKLTPRYEFGEGMASIQGDDAMSTTAPINNDLVSTVKELEGFAPQSQWDFKQWSVGYGTRGKKGESLTPQQAEARLRSELTMHAGNIDDAAADVKLSLTPGQRNALISFDFNTGKGAYLIRTSKGDPEEILRRLKLYVKADGKTLKGLVNRRNAEAEMFLT